MTVLCLRQSLSSSSLQSSAPYMINSNTLLVQPPFVKPWIIIITESKPKAKRPWGIHTACLQPHCGASNLVCSPVESYENMLEK